MFFVQGTPMGQKLHTAHMLILPLIPVFILLAQNSTNFIQVSNLKRFVPKSQIIFNHKTFLFNC